MNSRPELKIDWCGHDAAMYAVKNWHYSKSLPVPPLVKIGVWENSKFIGCVLFSRGANRNMLTPYGLKITEGCELVRVALTAHATPVTRIVAIALRFLRSHCPKLRLVVSFADPSEGHHGGIYQGGGWVFVGDSGSSMEYTDKRGKRWHPRMISPSGVKRVFGKVRRVLTPDQCTVVQKPGKHRYLMPLDAEMRERIKPLARPYPKRAGGDTTDTPVFQTGEGGSTPTSALQSSG